MEIDMPIKGAQRITIYANTNKLKSFKSSENIFEKGVGHTAVSAIQASSVTL